jgi:hypothetical protein
MGICGRAGAGKSTLAYGLSLRGHRLWADDALVLTAVDPPRTTALRGELRLLTDVRELLGLSSERMEMATEGGEEAPLPRIVVLRAGAQGENTVSSTRPLESGEAFASLVEHAYVYGFEGGKRRITEFFLELVAAVPVHEIVRREGLDGLSRTLDLAEELIVEGAD